MSIASRITQIEQHIGNAYDKIEDLGIDLTNVDKNIDNISSMLENVWNEYPKVTATDVEEATLNGTKKGRIEIDLKGQTSQNTLTGKNMINVTDKTIIPTGYDQYIINNYDIDNSKNYAISFDYEYVNTSFSSTGAIIMLRKDSNYTSLVSSTASISGHITASISNTSKLSLYITNRLESGTIKIKNVMLEQGSTATSYEPYCGGIPAPNPDFPEQIKNVTGQANVKIQNKNLAITNFPDNISLSGSGNNRTVVVSSYKLSQIIKVKPNTTYSINGNYSSISDQRIRIYYFDEYPNINVVSTKYIYSGQSSVYTFTTDATTEYILLYGAVSPLADVVIPNLQLEIGSTATSYVPHQEQNLPFSLKGKNLFDKNNPNVLNTVVDSNGLGSNFPNTYRSVYLPCKPNTTYTVSKLFDSTKNRFTVAYTTVTPDYNTSTYGNIGNSSASHITITTGSDAKYIVAYVWITGGSTTPEEMINSIQIEEGTTATSYEPYYDIRAMQGTTLEDDGIHNTRKQIVLDGTENWQYYQNNIFYCILNIPNIIRNTIAVNCLSDSYIAVNSSSSASDFETLSTNYNYSTNTHTTQNLIRIKDKRFTDVADLKSALTLKPVTFEYKLASEEIIPYNETQQTQYNAKKQARSYDDITYITSTSDELGFKMDVESLRKKEN